MKTKFKMFAALAASVALALSACSPSDSGKKDEAKDGGKKVLEFAAFEGGYGKDVWEKVVKAYEEQNKDVKVEMKISKTINEEIAPGMKAGKFPDVVYYSSGQKSGFTETLLSEGAVMKINDVFEMKVPGEDKTVKDKLLPGLLGGTATNPLGGEDTYLAPLFYAPNGFVYNKKLLADNGWEAPKTWDEMFKLGDAAKAKGIALFTYPVSGYFDSALPSIIANAGGAQLWSDIANYKEGAWESDGATKALETVAKLVSKDYLLDSTVGNANKENFVKNQQAILDGTAIFMPNGNWIVNEMKDAPRPEGFEWGVIPAPAFKDGGDRFAFSFVENIWIPAKAKNADLAKDFIAFLYSDKAVDIFAGAGAAQPVEGAADKAIAAATDPGVKTFFDMMKAEGVAAVAGGPLAKTAEGISFKDSVYGAIDSVASGDKTLEAWQKDIKEVTDKLRAAK
ncbi:carbohydrate ABC transporter substrate-binding protein [Arcanobacterium hippocoleae]|uniref:N-acetylglucosamine transport system substrate-binding protein n=1 Tax=Arcanobacterium hippocoleae TaxID=149017 RepID=A0ABU1SZN8_9ACTO|nr:carbohydrate ABC transporter substrate-binding protein [Arcanobacterium hippocoleae]MDR6938589.1 N-acetylglucosamine transport system substrate-binding protein [Arcanobacterium hippocoleae]